MLSPDRFFSLSPLGIGANERARTKGCVCEVSRCVLDNHRTFLKSFWRSEKQSEPERMPNRSRRGFVVVDGSRVKCRSIIGAQAVVYSHTVNDIAEVMMSIACVFSNGPLTSSSSRIRWENARPDTNEYAQTNEQAIQAVISATSSDIGNSSKQ